MRRLMLSITVLVLTVASTSANEIRILPLTGPVGSARILPPDGSTVAYRMDYAGQKAICFKSAAATDVYLGSHTVTTNGFPFFEIGESVCMDLSGGTTLYFYGNGASGDIRAIFAR